MSLLEQQLYEYMIKNEVPSDVAQRGAEECARQVQRNALLGFGTGVTVGLMTYNPGALLMGVATGGLLGAGTLIGSPSCEQVRNAAFKLAGEATP